MTQQSTYGDTSYLLKILNPLEDCGCLLNQSRLENQDTFADFLQLLTLAVCTSWLLVGGFAVQLVMCLYLLESVNTDGCDCIILLVWLYHAN